MIAFGPSLRHLLRLLLPAVATGCVVAALLFPFVLAQPLLPSTPASPQSLPLDSAPSGSAPANLPPGLQMGAPSQTAPVSSAASRGPDIHDLHDLVPLTFWERHGSEVIYAGICSIVLLGLVAWLLLRKKPKPPLTPIERARQELAAAHALLVTGQDKAFAIAVSSAVRDYLENAYHMPAPERTTEEFLQEAARHDWLKGELTALLRRFLELCDLAKFAGQQFGPAERDQLHAAAVEFVEAAERHLHPPSTKEEKPSSDNGDDDAGTAKPTARDIAQNLEKVSLR